jgi:predicted AAA+ superfamily ATPase
MRPWYTIIVPREDLRENCPLDASGFAVHLDHVRTGKAPDYYRDAHQFFERTFLTDNLQKLAVEVLRRLSGGVPF